MGQIDYKDVLSFYKDKRVLITGNTGFKGSWLTHILLSAGAEVIGYSLKPTTDPALFYIAGLHEHGNLKQAYEDVRDLDSMKKVFENTKPEIVLHLAAQPIVRDSYKDPVTTYSTNVMGTVNLCECIRTVVDESGCPIVRSFLNVTTDKVYRNNEWERGYVETDYLDGFDPYSNSKSCSELVTHSYRNAFFSDGSVAVSTARAGNVIGGGDFSNDRIIPDCVRAVFGAVESGESEGKVAVRNPYSTRPYQHVLEPLFTYLLIAKAQYEDGQYADYYNVGPDDCDCVSTGNLVTMFCDSWNRDDYETKASWENVSEKDAPHEANYLKLDCTKLKADLGWRPRWHIDEAIKQTVAWTKVWLGSASMSEKERTDVIRAEMDREIELFIS